MYKLKKENISGISPIIIENAEKDNMLLNIEGNSYQATREGYNLLYLNNNISGTKNGITYTWNGTKLILNGTTTAATDIYNFGFWGSTIENEKRFLESGIYTCYLTEGNNNNRFSFIAYSSNLKYLFGIPIGYNDEKEINLETSSYYSNCYISIPANKTFNNETFKIMLIKGKNKQEYEEYGIMPSLDYPSEVEAVGDNINLISNSSNDWEQGTLNGTTGQPQDSSARIRLKEYIDVRNIKSIACNLQNSNYKVVSIHFFGKDYSFITTSSTLYGYGNFNLQNMDLPKNTCYIKVIVSKTDVNSEIEISEIEQCKLKIESGSISTPYSPYNQGSTEIVTSNKNILNWLDLLNKIGITLPYTKEVSGITFKIDEKGTISVKGTSTSTINLYLTGSYTSKVVKYIINNAKDTIASGFNNNWSKGLTGVFFDNSSETNIHLDFYDSKNNKCTKDKFNVTGIMFALNSGVTIDETYNLMLEKGTITTDFIEHKGDEYVLPIQKPFHKIGKYTDGFARLGNQWYEQHFIKEVILTGDENYWYNSSNANTFLIHQPGTINTQLALCNYFPFVDSVTGKDILACDIAEIRESDFDFRFCLGSDTQYTTLNDWKSKVQELYNAGAPIKIYFVLSIPDLIECTEEQSNILNNFETFEGQNIITIDTFNNTNPNFLIDYTPKMTDEIKQAFTTNITKAYIIRTSDGFEINQDNYLKDYKLEELRFVPDNGFLGGTVARRLTLNFNNVDNQFNIQDEDLRLYAGVEYKGNDYYIDYGNFIVQKPETENTTDNTNATCLDYMCLLNATYNDEMTYPCTLGELAENVCSQAGLELATKTFRNSDFIVEDNQFVNGETLRVVLSGIALSAFSWARIGQDNKVYIDFQIKQKEDISLNYDNYFNLAMASKLYGPINKIILRNSQIEGENVTVQDDESIAANGVHELVIADNPFAYTQEKREQLIEAGKEFYGFSYMPITSMDSIGYIFLDSNSLMKITDMQDKEFYAYVLNHTIDYNGTVLDSIESPALTETETKYTYTPEDSQRLKRTEIIVNKHEQTISSIIQEQDELGNRQNIIEQDLDSTTDTISKVNEDLTEQINQLRIDLDGLTQNVSQKGGDNIFSYAKEFWTGETDEDEANLEEYTNTEIQQNSVSGIGYMIKQGISIQKVQVKNDTYTISFSYKKLIELATGYVLINGNRYDLTSTDWDEIVATINVETNYVDFEIISDTANAFEIFDLMGAIGNEKQIWSQNANETRTDTVKIGKGITVSSSSTKTIWKANSDGNRIINTDTNEVVAEFTDKGTTTKNLKVNDTAEIAGILIQEIDGQTWISSLL